MGYHRAGYEVVGVDIEPQSYYPFPFVLMDVLEALAVLLAGEYIVDTTGKSWYLSDFDLLHGSPPCQGYSVTEPMKRAVRKKKVHPRLIEPVRNAFLATGKPYVIENVVGAPLISPMKLNGAMFGLKVKRARLFEIWPEIYFVPIPAYQPGMTALRGEYDRGQRGLITVAGHNFDPIVAREAMDIDWMTSVGLAQAIPPAYTEYIGNQLKPICERMAA